ncbi:MAG: hypothetical protein K5786_02220 [Treponema sp.]|nr:hypothetical protein [Treponema sp.]
MHYIKKNLFLTIIFLLICNSCYRQVGYIQIEEENEAVLEDLEIEEVVVERKWSLLIYMAADNNLETAALEDFCEMELSSLNTDEVTVLVLLDRSALYDTSNSNWSGTRLYCLNTGRTDSAQELISEEIDCPLLALEKDSSVKLTLSSGAVLSHALTFMRAEYPADNYGLIMWGHGTGWRYGGSLSCGGLASNAEPASSAGDETCTENTTCAGDATCGGLTFSAGYASSAENATCAELASCPESTLLSQSYKAFAFDDTSQTSMSLRELALAIKNSTKNGKLDFIGFDTCFGSELEIIYELRDCVKYLAGSEGLLLSSGWNYTELFSSFQQESSKTAETLASCVITQFKNQFQKKTRASVAALDVAYAEELFKAFDSFMLCAADKIDNREIRDKVIGKLYSDQNCTTERFCYGTESSDVYLDLLSAVENLRELFSEEDLEEEEKCEIQSLYSVIKNALENCVMDSWCSDSQNTRGIGFYFTSLGSGALLSAIHPSEYIKYKSLEQIDFVTDSNGYVPCEQSGNSFLDKVFYTSF